MDAGAAWVLVHESTSPRDCDDRLLVLEAIGIPAVMSAGAGSYGVYVAAEHAVRASDELERYRRENPPAAPPPARPRLHGRAIASAGVWLVVLLACAGASSRALFGEDWYAAGVLDGALVRGGEAWRSVTALTLHADAAHLLSNLGFGALFGTLVARVYGPGVGWLAIVVAGAVANLANALWTHAGYVSLGASTAVFAALGLLAAVRWPDARARVRAGVRGGSLVAALVLLALLGTGDARTDVAAHALGFVAGLGGGALLHRAVARGVRPQWPWGALALALVAGAWAIALSAGS